MVRNEALSQWDPSHSKIKFLCLQLGSGVLLKVSKCFVPVQITLSRNKVWIGIKVLQANSIILGTRKLWRIFPIKQKFSNTTTFFIVRTFKLVNFWQRCLTILQPTCTVKTLSDTLPNFSDTFLWRTFMTNLIFLMIFFWQIFVTNFSEDFLFVLLIIQPWQAFGSEYLLSFYGNPNSNEHT